MNRSIQNEIRNRLPNQMLALPQVFLEGQLLGVSPTPGSRRRRPNVIISFKRFFCHVHQNTSISKSRRAKTSSEPSSSPHHSFISLIQ